MTLLVPFERLCQDEPTLSLIPSSGTSRLVSGTSSSVMRSHCMSQHSRYQVRQTGIGHVINRGQTVTGLCSDLRLPNLIMASFWSPTSSFWSPTSPFWSPTSPTSLIATICIWEA